MVNALSDVDGSILDCKKSIEEFDNELLSLHTEIFNRIQKQFSNLDSEISNIIDLFDDMDVSDDKGIWSKEGIAQLGLLTQQYELAQYQVQQYNNEIDELNAQYLAGRYSATEYADRLASLNEEQWSAVKASESALSAIKDLNKARVDNAVKGIEKEKDAYKELIDAQLDAIDKEKSLRDYKNDVADKNKKIVDIERQISALQYDTSASGIAKRKKLEEQLVEAKKDLAETEYEHGIEVQKDALNTQYSQYEKERNDEIETLKDSLNDTETILANSFATVKENASLVGQEIATIAIEHGVTISDTLISSWQSGETAIASYGEVLSQNTSAFIGNLMGVENEVWNLQAQANNTANSLAWMFSTKADNLVDELATSYYAEANLATMTNALQNSLISTLERGYNVSSIVDSLASIESAARNAKEAIDDMNNASSGNAGTPIYNSSDSSRTTSGNIGSNSVDPSSYFTDDVGKNVGKSLNEIKTENSYRLIDIMTGKIWKDGLTYDEVQKLYKDKTVASHTRIEKYASGTRNSKGGIIITDEKGDELKLPKLSDGQYTIANEGTQIFSKEQTDRLYELANTDMSKWIPFKSLTFEDMQKMWGNVKVPEAAIDKRMNNASNTLQIQNLVNVQGNVNDMNIKQFEKIAQGAADRAIKKLSEGIRR